MTTDNTERKITVVFSFDWDDSEDVHHQLMMEDAIKICKEGVSYEIVSGHPSFDEQGEAPEMPEEIKVLLLEKMSPYHNPLSFKSGAVELYKIIFPELTKLIEDSVFWNRRSVELTNDLSMIRQERDDYREQLEIMRGNVPYFGIGTANSALKMLDKYPSPYKSDNGK